MVARDYPQIGQRQRSVLDVKNVVPKLPLPVWLFLLAVVIPLGVELGPLAITLLRLYLMLMIIPLFLQLISGKFGRIIAADVFFTLHVLWMIISLSVMSADRMIEQVGSNGVEFLGGYLIGRAFIRTREDFLAMCRGLVLVVMCLLPFALIENLIGNPVLLEALRGLPGSFTIERNYSAQRMGFYRAQSLFAHPIHFGLFCSVVFSLCFVALKGTMSTSWRFILSAMLAFGTLSSLSSGALLAIFLQFGLIIWAFMFRKVPFRWWLLVGLFTLAYVVIDLLSNRTPVEVFMSYATFSAHNAFWRAIIFEWGMKNIYDNPIFGIGLNDWVRPAYMYSGSMDNFWLVIGVKHGFPGVILLMLGYLISLGRVTFRKFGTDTTLSQLRLAWVYTFMGLTFTLCTVHVWTNIYSFTFFMFGSGMWLLSAQAQSDADSENDAPEEVEMRANQYTRFPPKSSSR